jgi:hypothetical protein
LPCWSSSLGLLLELRQRFGFSFRWDEKTCWHVWRTEWSCLFENDEYIISHPYYTLINAYLLVSVIILAIWSLLFVCQEHYAILGEAHHVASWLRKGCSELSDFIPSSHVNVRHCEQRNCVKNQAHCSNAAKNCVKCPRWLLLFESACPFRCYLFVESFVFVNDAAVTTFTVQKYMRLLTRVPIKNMIRFLAAFIALSVDMPYIRLLHFGDLPPFSFEYILHL